MAWQKLQSQSQWRRACLALSTTAQAIECRRKQSIIVDSSSLRNRRSSPQRTQQQVIMASSTRLALVALAINASALVAPGRQRAQIRMGMGNSFGRCFRISTWGESHGGGVGVVVDGCPPRVPLTEEPVQFELNRRDRANRD